MSRSRSRTAGTSCNIVPGPGGKRTGVLPYQMFILIFGDLRFPISLAFISYSTHLLQYCCPSYSLFYTTRTFGTCLAINAPEI